MLDALNSMIEKMVTTDTLPGLFISTVILVLIIVVARAVVTRLIRRNVASIELQRRWRVQTRNGFILLLLFGLVLIWGAELRTLAFSVVAIAVAFVVATKELILCVTGSILKSGSRSFNVGDRIQIKDFRGDVIDQNLFTTTVLEVGPGKITHQRSGRMIVIPNSLFVSDPVINESYTQKYVLHVFSVPFKREDNWQEARTAFLESAGRHCISYLEDARKHMEQLIRQKAIDVPNVEPRVTIQVPVAGEVHLIIRVPVRSGQRGYIEQSIMSDVFTSHDFTSRKDS